MMVLDDADLDTVAAALSTCFSNTGQLCVSIERIYVDTRWPTNSSTASWRKSRR